jgi:catechol 2,3-dioxygenase-like lactoylglutathione lyase family enzyme
VISQHSKPARQATQLREAAQAARSEPKASGESQEMDVGLTHIALPVTDVEASIAFYERYAAMRVVHRRSDSAQGHQVVWVSDGTRAFVIVLIQVDRVTSPLLPIAHLGVGCASRAEVDRLIAESHAEGRNVWGPTDSPPPVGYWALIADPDGHTLELSHGQDVALAVANG